MYNSLPRAIKSLPMLDALMRPHSDSIYDAIFNVDVELEDADNDEDLFGTDTGRNNIGLHSWASRPSAAEEANAPAPGIYTPPRNRAAEREQLRLLHAPDAASDRDRGRSAPGSPRGRKVSGNVPNLLTVGAAASPLSLRARPTSLAKLFTGRREAESVERVDDSVRRIQDLLEETKKLPVNSLKAEMKELQERQARIEGLLLTLTRGMRHEVGTSGSK
jgi:hypothetical protein